jgi:triosephosphate isomerase (TIM)
MSARTPLIAGNWKMNCGTQSGRDLARAIKDGAGKVRVDLIVAPPFTLLATIVDELRDSLVGVAAQNVHERDDGAYTGEISIPMLKYTGCQWVIIGHSERRSYFNENDQTVGLKTKAALKHSLKPIVCVGETLEERQAGRTLEVVSRQLDAFKDALAERPGFGVIAYEPVWAIGTGVVATTAQAQEVHAAIRAHLAATSTELAAQTRLLYGGSVKADNAPELLGCADVDGALVGGASLDAEGFLKIAAAAPRQASVRPPPPSL